MKLKHNFEITFYLFALFYYLFYVFSQAYTLINNNFEVKAAEATIDATTSTTFQTHRYIPATVFVSDTTGYVFYKETTGTIGYAKTTDGGANWSSYQATTTQTDIVIFGIWYDQWTPGNTSGTKIHIVMLDTGSDDVWYDTLDTNGDTQGTEEAIYTGFGNTIAAADNANITKATDGALYIVAANGSDAPVIRKCTTNCSTDTNWSTKATYTSETAADPMYLMPLASGNIMVIRHDTDLEDIESKVYNSSGDSWDANFADINSNSSYNTTWTPAFAATVDRSSNDIYVVYNEDIQSSSSDVRTAIYSSGAWTTKTDVITDFATTGHVNIALDENTGDVYVAYIKGPLQTGATAQYKVSTDGMETWGDETQFNTTGTDIRYVSMNMMSTERIYGIYFQNTGSNDGVFGNTIADLSSVTVSITLTTDGSVGFGNMAVSQTKDTTASGINDVETISVSTGPADLDVKSTNWAGASGTWTLGSSIGSDTMKLEYSGNGSSWSTFIATDTLYSLATNVAQSNTQSLYLKLNTPSSTTYYETYTGTITIVASAP